MGFLIDTNVLSELRKASKMDNNVRKWFEAVPSDEIYLSTLTVGEVRHGIELLRRRDPKGLIAATAIVHGHILVTRNVRDIEPTGVKFINPFNQKETE